MVKKEQLNWRLKYNSYPNPVVSVSTSLKYYSYERNRWREDISRTDYLDIYGAHQKYLKTNRDKSAFETSYIKNRDIIEAYHSMIDALDNDHKERNNKLNYADKIKAAQDEFRLIEPKNSADIYPSTYATAEAAFVAKKKQFEQELNTSLHDRQKDYAAFKLRATVAYIERLDAQKQAAIHAYLAQKEAIEAYLLQEDVKKFWNNFDNRQNVVWCASLLYGLLQGWGMAGFALFMVKNAELGQGTEWTIALTIAIPVTLVNTWLVRPDIENYIGFEKYRDLLNGKISRKAVAITTASSLLYASIVSFGITNSFDTDDTRILAPVFGVITGVLCLAEGMLSIGSLDEILETGFGEKHRILLDEYKDDKDCEAKQRKASIAFYTVFITSCVGMIGIALVGSKTLANQILGDDNPMNLALSCLPLLAAVCSQLPFYQDRALRLARRWVPADGAKEEVPVDRLVFNPNSKTQHVTQQALWTVNGLFNAPAAYLSVTTVLGKFLGLHKTKGILDENGNSALYDSQSTFGQIFFQYGNSMEANIVYGIATLFFLTAVGISMSANCVKPQIMADPKKEYAVAKHR